LNLKCQFGEEKKMHIDVQKLINAALDQGVESYLDACKAYEAVTKDPSDENKRRDAEARERKAGNNEMLGALLDAAGYNVRMVGPALDEATGESLGETFIAWPKTEREVIKRGYATGRIERDHMVSWYDHHQENGWLRYDKQEVPA
jgi:hypothetical protein